MPNDVAVAPVKLAAPKLWVFRAPRGRPRSQREVRERLRDGAVARDLARRALDLGQENHVDRALRRGGLGTVVRDRGVERGVLARVGDDDVPLLVDAPKGADEAAPVARGGAYRRSDVVFDRKCVV